MNAVLSGCICAAGIAVLELDSASIGPFLVSRPFVVGPLFGFALGKMWVGGMFGVIFEALTLNILPLGGCLTFSPTVAAGVSVWLTAGPFAIPGEASFLCGIGAGWIHARVESHLRRRRGAAVGGVEKEIRAGGQSKLGLILAQTLAIQATCTWTVAAIFFVAGSFLPSLWSFIPSAAKYGMLTAFQASPWLAGGCVAGSLWGRA